MWIAHVFMWLQQQIGFYKIFVLFFFYFLNFILSCFCAILVVLMLGLCFGFTSYANNLVWSTYGFDIFINFVGSG
jgi:hypothetical protein